MTATARDLSFTPERCSVRRGDWGRSLDDLTPADTLLTFPAAQVLFVQTLTLSPT
jgi:hypothetical protein